MDTGLERRTELQEYTELCSVPHEFLGFSGILYENGSAFSTVFGNKSVNSGKCISTLPSQLTLVLW